MSCRRVGLAGLVVALATVASASPVFALSLVPLSSFGGGDGWLSPDEASFLNTNNTQRGLTYNQRNNHLYVVDRDGGTNVRVVDGDTGALISSLDVTGISGGTFPLNMIDVADDGAIYAANLSTSATSNFKIYRWANEAAAPTVAFDAASGLPRTGDSFAVRGGDVGTQIIASGSGSTGFKRFTTADGSSYTDAGTNGTTAVAGGFRLGLDFVDGSTALGQQSTTDLNVGDFSNGAVSVFSVNAAGETALAHWEAGKLLATVDINTSDVRLYDSSDLSLLTSSGFMDLANNTSSFTANGNGVGDLKFGNGPDGSLRLYAMNTNNGIQAFRVVVPEPASLVLLLGVAVLGVGRRR
jgi:hypothetical protein